VEDDKKNQEFITDEVVSKYLMGNPDFFERNESALSSLVIPHVRSCHLFSRAPTFTSEREK
jgi:uncharacterized protein YigA (DUF484 family)